MNKGISAIAGIFLIISCLFFAGGCSQDGKAIVTIDLGLHKQARLAVPSLFDRVLAFLTMSTSLAADQPPSGISDVSIIVSSGKSVVFSGQYSNNVEGKFPYAPDFFEKGAVTLELEAGVPYYFEVKGYNYGSLYAGGIKVATFSAGENMLNIMMGNVPQAPDSFSGGDYSNETPPWYFTITWTPVSDPSVIAYKVYLSMDNETFMPVAIVPASTPEYVQHNVINTDTSYYYQVSSISSKYGEGNPSSTQEYTLGSFL